MKLNKRRKIITILETWSSISPKIETSSNWNIGMKGIRTLFTGKGLPKITGITIKHIRVKKNNTVENVLILLTE